MSREVNLELNDQVAFRVDVLKTIMKHETDRDVIAAALAVYEHAVTFVKQHGCKLALVDQHGELHEIELPEAVYLTIEQFQEQAAQHRKATGHDVIERAHVIDTDNLEPGYCPKCVELIKHYERLR